MESERKGRSNKSSTAKSGEFVNLLDFSELEEDGKKLGDRREPIADIERDQGFLQSAFGREEDESRIDGRDIFSDLEQEVQAFEQRFGSRYLQILGVFVISIAFSILGYNPSSLVPVWGQVAFMFLGAGFLILFGEILMERKEMEFYALGLVFAGIKLVYSSFWSLYYNFDLIDINTFTLSLVGALAFHYLLTIRYRSAVLNASFVFISWMPLILVKDIIGDDTVIIGLFFIVIFIDLFQTHIRKAATALMIVPATVFFYFLLVTTEVTFYDFAFTLEIDEVLLGVCTVVYIGGILFLLALNYRSKTLLTDYFHDLPGTTFSQLISLFTILSILSLYPLLPAEGFAFLITLLFTGLIIVHFHERGEELLLLCLPVGSALALSLSPVISFVVSGDLLLPISLLLVVVLEMSSSVLLQRPFLTSVQRLLIRGNHLALACVTLAFWFLGMDSFLFLPAIFLIFAIADQLLISYSYIQDLHIITGELILLLIVGSYAWISGDGLGSTVAWIVILLLFTAITRSRREGDLTSQVLFILACSLILTSPLMGEFILFPGILMVLSLGHLSSTFTGPYFLDKLHSPINEISLILRKYRILDPYNISVILSLTVSLVSLRSSATAWILVPFTATIFLIVGLHLHRGKLVLPILLLISGGLLIYLESLVLLTYLTLFPVVIVLLLKERSNVRIDHYLQMILFITVGVAVGVNELKGGWLWGEFSLDLPIRLLIVYLFYLLALGGLLSFSKRYSSLLFTGLVALGEIAALLMFTFEYPHSIPIFFGIMLILIVYFGVYLLDHAPAVHQRNWLRDRMFLLFISALIYYLVIIIFNYRNDVHEFSLWGYGLLGVIPLLLSDIMRNGIHPQMHVGRSSTPQFGLTGTELFLLLLPSLLCMNFSEDISLWVCLSLYLLVLLIILIRETASRFQMICLFGAFFYLPFNFLLFVGRIDDPLLHALSDIPPLILILLYVLLHGSRLIDVIIPTHTKTAIHREYSWLISIGLLILGTFASSHVGMIAIPVIMFLFCFRMRDLLSTPASYVMLMFILYLYFSTYRDEHDMALDLLVFMSLLPIFIGLFSEAIFRVKPLTFSFSFLSFMLMFGVPWFAAGSGSYVGTVITNFVWTIFGGTAFSAGFYLDRRYLRIFGILFLFAGILVTIYNTVILGWEAVVASFLTFGAIAIIASYFYHIRDERYSEQG